MTRPRKTTFDESEAMKLYNAGKNDTQIAAELVCRWQDIQKWRARNGLPSNLNRRYKYIVR